ncbi:MAG: hypothetical protein AB9882_10375 [Ignavibacteriaceae bacterium]
MKSNFSDSPVSSNKWSVSDGDYTADRPDKDPYTELRKEKKINKSMLNLFYLLFSAGVVVFIIAAVSGVSAH